MKAEYYYERCLQIDRLQDIPCYTTQLLLCNTTVYNNFNAFHPKVFNTHTHTHTYAEWAKKMYTLFTHQYLWNKFKLNFYFRVRV